MPLTAQQLWRWLARTSSAPVLVFLYTISHSASEAFQSALTCLRRRTVNDNLVLELLGVWRAGQCPALHQCKQLLSKKSIPAIGEP